MDDHIITAAKEYGYEEIEIRVNGKLAFHTSEPLTEEEREQRISDILTAPIDPEAVG